MAVLLAACTSVPTPPAPPATTAPEPAVRMPAQADANALSAFEQQHRQKAVQAAAQHRRTVERAVQYMRSHASEPIGVVDICQAVGVHSRVLQYCFNEVFGVTPVAYLRCLRLHQVRREIKEAPNESLGDIAARWGIWHLGRFASDYKRLFGELPSTTARNAGAMPAGAPRVLLPN